MQHGGPAIEEGLSQMPAALHAARVYLFGATSGENLFPEYPRGHFKLRFYSDEGHEDGHWGLEVFPASKTMPFSLSDAMMWITQDAVQWFFDPEKVIPDPIPYRREINREEIIERLRGYQHFIDIETRRDFNQALLPLPPLTELPEEIQRRLVQHWEHLWWDWLDLHPDYRWMPMLGFWRTDETIYYLEGPTDPVKLGSE